MKTWRKHFPLLHLMLKLYLSPSSTSALPLHCLLHLTVQQRLVVSEHSAEQLIDTMVELLVRLHCHRLYPRFR